jgi:hypothetical protein
VADVVVTDGASQPGSPNPSQAAAIPAQNTNIVKLEIAQIAAMHTMFLLYNRENI